jgi:hypothetical protein
MTQGILITWNGAHDPGHRAAVPAPPATTGRAANDDAECTPNCTPLV